MDEVCGILYGQATAHAGSRADRPAESFFVKIMKKKGPLLAGEEARAARWALAIHLRYETRTAHLAAHEPEQGNTPVADTAGTPEQVLSHPT